MKMAYIQNGTSRAAAKNGRAAKAKNGTKRRANGLTVARAKTFLAKNGMKAVPKAQNPKRRKSKRGRRRNGLQTSVMTRTRNGIFGNTKQDVKQVGFLAAGAAITKGLGRILAGFAAPYLSQMGLGRYVTIISDGAVALVAIPWAARKVVRSRDAETFGRLGGLLVVGLDVANVFAPDTLASYNPFIDISPIVMTNDGRPAVEVKAVKQAMQEIVDSPNPKAEAAKLAGAMDALNAAQGFQDSAGYLGGSAGYVDSFDDVFVA